MDKRTNELLIIIAKRNSILMGSLFDMLAALRETQDEILKLMFQADNELDDATKD